MSDKKYQVLFYGEILPGADIASVKKNLADIFNVDISKVEELFSGGKKIVKKDASREVCEKTKNIFMTAGAVVSVVPQPTRSEPLPPPGDFDPVKEAVPVDNYPPSAVPGPLSSPEIKIADGKVNKTTLLLLTFSLGAFGTHKFYLARYVQGFLYMLFSWTFIPFLLSVFDFLIYTFTSEEQLTARYKTGSTPLTVIMAVCGPFIFIIAMVIMLAMAFPLLLVAGQGDGVILPVLKMISEQSAVSVQYGSSLASPGPTASRTRKIKPINPVGEDSPAAAVGTCSGQIKGRIFSVDQSYLQDDALHLVQGNGIEADQEVIVFLFLDDKDIANRHIHVSGNDRAFKNPHIHLKWKTGENKQQSSVAMKGYDLDLEFGQVRGGSVPGKISLYIPGKPETRLKGTFTAEVADL